MTIRTLRGFVVAFARVLPPLAGFVMAFARPIAPRVAVIAVAIVRRRTRDLGVVLNARAPVVARLGRGRK